MPVEKSGQNEFDFEYGEDFARAHLEVRPRLLQGPRPSTTPTTIPEMNERQLGRLKRLADWLHDNGRKFLFELLVPATDGQLASVDGDTDRYDAEMRPGPDAPGDRATSRSSGSRSTCGRSRASTSARMPHAGRSDPFRRGSRGRRLRAAWPRRVQREGRPLAPGAAPVDGFIGFAIGRSIWWDALKGFLDGGLEREAAASQIADNYLRFVQVYEGQAVH